jgi:Fe-S-cluster containining protein
MPSREDVLIRYQELVGYCDAFWRGVAKRFPEQLACREGCCSCCTLSSVNYIEALIIAALYRRIPKGATLQKKDASEVVKDAPCPFLCGGRCLIYCARPLICRTHGLLLSAGPSQESFQSSCAMNFAGMDRDIQDDVPVLDMKEVSESLAKLNAAFCMLLGDVTKAAERVHLADLASGKIGVSFFSCR